MRQPLIGIIGGKGKMGSAFAELFKSQGYPVIVSDRKTALTNIRLARQADVVIVSVPMDVTEAVICQVSPHVKPSSLLMDLTSLKVGPMKAMQSTRASYLGCHPLFGPSNFTQGQVVALCLGRGEKWFQWFKRFLVENKMIVCVTTPQKHDGMMAYVQVLTHFTDITLADALRRSGIKMEEFLQYQSPSYRLKLDMMGRILDQNANLYGNIQIQNPLSSSVIRDYLKSCLDFARFVDQKDLKSFEDSFNAAAHYLGDFRHQAMRESNQLIENCFDSQSTSILISPRGDETIAVLGPKNTYSDLALKSFRPKAKVYYAHSIIDAFEWLEKKSAREALVPIENSITGSVRETLDELWSRPVWIQKVVGQSIHLTLAGIKKVPLASLRILYSHPQALLQCRQFLRKHCPKAVLIPVESTAQALERVQKEKNPASAAIAAPLAIKAARLILLRDTIEDSTGNITYFALIRRGQPAHSRGKKTSIAFRFSRDSAGSLYIVLGDFAAAKINLTKIESRPNPRTPGDYVFYLDFEGALQTPRVQKTLRLIRQKVTRLKILGCY